jgi:hypothetical protein
MKVQTLKQRLRLQEWASHVKACEESGMSAKQWCEENGINVKTYSTRLRRVREEMLEALELRGCGQLPGTEVIAARRTPMQVETPVFAALSMPQSKSAAVTVWLGGYAVDIQNGAEDAIVEQTLRVVSRL